MYNMREFAEKLNLVDQLPGYNISVHCDRILIDGLDFRLDLYGWPDNRVVFSNKVTGMNTIKRYGHAGGVLCCETYLDFLESLGVDTEAVR
jgi:hypothetical protein